jgi:dethiobiotin synthetase
MLSWFIPNIQKGIMEVLTYHETLRCQAEFVQNTIAISIEGIGGLKVEINHQGTFASLADFVKQLKSDAGNCSLVVLN